MRAQGVRTIAAILLLAACTSTSSSPTTSGPSTPSSTGTPSPSAEPSGPLAFGQPLPADCPQEAVRASQTVTFVAAGRAWALSPANERLTCLFRTDDPGPFVWGPQGDRVLLGGMRILFLDGSEMGPADAPNIPLAFDWGRPVGKSVVFRDDRAEAPSKYVLADDEVYSLGKMPDGTYEDIAYHPSGLALAVSVKAKNGTPGIYVSTNEGERPDRIVVGVSATDFPSVDFTSDGRTLLYLAAHKGEYAQLHMIDLTDPTHLVGLWKSTAGVHATGLQLPPGIGDTLAFTTGTACEDSQAVWGSVNEVSAVLPDETRPTRAIGYLDDERLLVAAQDCAAGTIDLYAVTEDGADLLVTGVDAAAARSNGPDDAAPLPEELLGDVQEFG